MYFRFDTDADDIVRIRNTALIVDNIRLGDNMHNPSIHRNHNSLCSLYHTVNILLVYFAVSLSFIGNGDDAAGINPFDMGAAYSGDAVSNFHAGHHLCSFYR